MNDECSHYPTPDGGLVNASDVHKHVAEIVSLGGRVSFPYKTAPDDWVESAAISLYAPDDSGADDRRTVCFIFASFGGESADVPGSVERFCSKVFSLENLAYPPNRLKGDQT